MEWRDVLSTCLDREKKGKISSVTDALVSTRALVEHNVES